MTVDQSDHDMEGNFSLNALTPQSKKEDFLITSSCRVLADKSTDQIFFTSPQTVVKNFASFSTFQIQLDPGMNYITYHPSSDTINTDKLWLLVQNKYPDRNVQILQSDYVRFGSHIVKIQRIQKELTSQNIRESQREIQDFNPMEASLRSNPGSIRNIDNNKICKLCQNPGTNEVPLNFDVCACAKTSPVHLDCWSNWLIKRCHRRFNDKALYIDMTKMKCELCGSRFPNQVEISNKIIKIVDIDRHITRPHVIISVFRINSEEIVSYYMFEFDKNDERVMRVGRTTNNEIQLRDPSVSDLHAQLWWSKGKIFLIDENSEHGTMVKLPNVFSLEPNTQPKIVTDKFLLNAHIMTSENPCKCIKKKEVSVIENPFTSNIPYQNMLKVDHFSQQAVSTKTPIFTNSGLNAHLPDELTNVIQKAPTTNNFDLAESHLINPSIKNIHFLNTPPFENNHQSSHTLENKHHSVRTNQLLPIDDHYETSQRNIQNSIHVKNNNNVSKHVFSSKYVAHLDHDLLSTNSGFENTRNIIKNEFKPKYDYSKGPGSNESFELPQSNIIPTQNYRPSESSSMQFIRNKIQENEKKHHQENFSEKKQDFENILQVPSFKKKQETFEQVVENDDFTIKKPKTEIKYKIVNSFRTATDFTANSTKKYNFD